MQSIFKTFFNNIADDLNVKDKRFKALFLESLMIMIGLLVCAFIENFVYVVLAISILFVLINFNNVKIIYFALIFLPYTLYFKDLRNMRDLLQYIYLAICVCLVLSYIIDLVKKQKSINIGFTVSYFVLVIYVSQPWNFICFIKNIELCLSLIILYFVLINIHMFNVKEILFIMLLSVLSSCFIGTFQPYSQHMDLLLARMLTEQGYMRFHGCGATNILGCELAFLISLLIIFHYEEKLKVIQFLFLPVCIHILLQTYSKVAFITLIFVVLYVLIRGIKNKKIHNVIALLLICLFVFLVDYQYVTQIFIRTGLVQTEISSISVYPMFLLTSFTCVKLTFKEDMLNKFTTGRFIIWKTYIKDLLSSPKIFIFGHGVGLQNLQVEGWGKTGITPHNTYLYILNQYGFFIILPIIACLYFFFKEIKREKTNKEFIPLIVFMLLMISEDFMVYEFIPFIIISVIFLFEFNKKEVKTYEKFEGFIKSL